MAQVKGKFITLTGFLMSQKDDKALSFSDKILFSKTGKHWNELDPEGWYDTSLFNGFMKSYEASASDEKAIIKVGKHVYPTIKETVGLPPEIKTAFDLIVFEAKGFELNHKGDDVKPRQFVKKQDGFVIVKAPAPGYTQKLYIGVFLGILEMFGITQGKVTMTKGKPDFEYEIKW
jgi:hypothetical protein